VEQRLAIIDSTSDARVRNRLEQSLQGQFGQQIARPQQFSQWREQTNLRNQEVILEQWSSESASQFLRHRRQSFSSGPALCCCR